MKKLIVSLVGAVLLAMGSTAGADPPAVPVLNWFPCAPGADCAVAQVPLDYDEPQGAQTYIVLARYPAADQANRIGTLFVNFGGPGISGVNRLLGGAGQLLAAATQGRFDVVSFDPRGVGLSDPLQCFATEADRAAYFSTVPIFPYRDDQERHFFDVISGLAPVCFGRNLRITAHMSTADVARDLDLLRAAVGDERITYFGFSYGSFVGNTYANLFPNKIRALVIDGVIDPHIWVIGRQISSDRVATAAVLDEFLRLCDEAAGIHPALCPASGPDGAAAKFDALAEALKDVPVLLPDGSLYTYDRLIADANGCLYTPEIWPDCAAFIGFLSNAVRGEPAAAQQVVAARQVIIVRSRAAAGPQTRYANMFDASYGVLCADTEYRRPFAVYAALDGWTEKGSIFGPYWWWGNAGCANWPLSPDRYAGPWTARTSASVLIVGNYFDPATDYAGALASDKWLKNSRLLSYAGWGHIAFTRNACVQGHVINYLLNGALPAEGTVCPANPNPFFPVSVTGAASTFRSVAPSIGGPTLWPGAE
jgi:pimeloyl-ACP methyl ester carboxylesterase